MTVDGTTYELQVAVCGWSGGGPTRPLQSDPGSRRSFAIIGVASFGTGVVGLDMVWDGITGTIDTDVLMVDPSEPGSAFHYHYDLQSIDLVAIDGGHVATVEPLTVYDGSNLQTAGRHALEIDLTCETFGGTFSEGAMSIITEITGLEPPAPDVGEVTVNGVATAVDVTRCSRSGDEVELEAESPDGSISMTLSVSPGFNFLFFSVDGRVLTVSGEVALALDSDGVRTTSPISGEIAGRGPADVALRLPCPPGSSE